MNAITFVNLGKVPCAEYSIPFIERYAAKCGAVIDPIEKFTGIAGADPSTRRNIYFEKFQLYRLLEKYDRVMLLDLDILIRHRAPDLFKIVPQDLLGVTIIGHVSKKYIDGAMAHALPQTNIDRYDALRYACAGLIVASKKHRELWNADTHRKIIDATKCQGCADQDAMNLIWRNEQIFHIAPRYQFVCWRKDLPLNVPPGQEWENRHSADIIHYCGGAAKNDMKADADVFRLEP